MDLNSLKEEITHELETATKEKDLLEKGLKAYVEKIAALEQHIAAIDRQVQSDNRLKELQYTLPIPIEESYSGKVNAKTGKPNSLIYEEVIREYGKPMYITDVVDAALLKGAVLHGKNAPKNQVRNALSTSKRFENVGDNTWWIIGEPLAQVTESPLKQVDMLGQVAV